MKKLICALTLLCLLLTPALAEGGAAGGHTLDEKTMDFYLCDAETVMPGSVCFVDGSDVPYLALSRWPEIIAHLAGMPVSVGPSFSELSFSMTGNVGTLTRGDGYTAAFDCDSDTIDFLDYNAFLRSSDSSYLIDVLDSDGITAPDGSVRYFRRKAGSYERYGREVKIDAGAYGIDFIAAGDDCYVPVQTLSDVFLSHYYMSIFYNGEAVFFVPYNSLGSASALTPLGEKFFSVQPHARSETLARFAYDELCLAMDTFYGLKQSHDIQHFDELADNTGLKRDLIGTDPVRADAALYSLLSLHLDDLHTYYRLPSPLSGVSAANGFADELGRGQSSLNMRSQSKLYREARQKAYPDGVPAYEEVGNTAFITFDHFLAPDDDVDYYQTPPTPEAEDTLGIMSYAYSQITREGSPIENVVLDLSCNMGGESDAAIYTIAAYLGTCSVSAKDPLTGAMVTGNYEIDINLDGVIDEKDLGLQDRNLFCLESPVSFSCGNLVTCAFKNSNRVLLLGRASGGGACIVYPFSTADGTSFQTSGNLQLSFTKNGSFYDIDQDAEPDIPLMKPATFYDRQALAEIVNGVR